MAKPNQLVISEEFIEIIQQLLVFFKGDIKKTRFWMITPNLNFGGIAPLKLIAIGKQHKVLQFIKDQRDEGGWGEQSL